MPNSANRINTSFKNTDEDMKLLAEVNSYSDKSAFIKDALRFYIKYRHLETILQDLIKKEQIKKGV